MVKWIKREYNTNGVRIYFINIKDLLIGILILHLFTYCNILTTDVQPMKQTKGLYKDRKTVRKASGN